MHAQASRFLKFHDILCIRQDLVYSALVKLNDILSVDFRSYTMIVIVQDLMKG